MNYFLKIYYFIFFVCSCVLLTYVGTQYAYSDWGGTRSSGTEIMYGWEPPCGCWQHNLCPRALNNRGISTATLILKMTLSNRHFKKCPIYQRCFWIINKQNSMDRTKLKQPFSRFWHQLSWKIWEGCMVWSRQLRIVSLPAPHSHIKFWLWNLYINQTWEH